MLVLVFTFVYIQGSICFVLVKAFLLDFLEISAICSLLNLSVFLLIFGIYRLNCYPGVVGLFFVLH